MTTYEYSILADRAEPFFRNGDRLFSRRLQGVEITIYGFGIFHIQNVLTDFFNPLLLGHTPIVRKKNLKLQLRDPAVLSGGRALQRDPSPLRQAAPPNPTSRSGHVASQATRSEASKAARSAQTCAPAPSRTPPWRASASTPTTRVWKSSFVAKGSAPAPTSTRTAAPPCGPAKRPKTSASIAPTSATPSSASTPQEIRLAELLGSRMASSPSILTSPTLVLHFHL